LKKFTLICLVSLFIIQAKATVITVVVTGGQPPHQFTPANFTCVVGDTVRFSCSEGLHNVSTLVRTGINGLPFSGIVPLGAPDIFSGTPLPIVWGYDYKVLAPGNYRYYCQVHTFDGIDGHVGTFTANVPFPAELKNFDARFENKAIAVSWQTLTEQNVNYFAVKRSFNGVEFSEITRVRAKGNSADLQSYRFVDNTAGNSSPYIYYSLSTVDQDGKQTTSPVVAVKNVGAGRKLITSLSPNPVTKQGRLIVQFNADNISKLNAVVYNAVGKKVTVTNLNSAVGLNNGQLDVGNLAPGMYNIVFTFGQQRETHRVIIQ
jgi:plastocyanin